METYETYTEPSRELGISEEFDVIVCGGGPAGTAAAVASARAGADTCLIERNGALGGLWTAGLLSWIHDCGNKSGLMTEIMQKLEDRGAGRVVKETRFVCDHERLKLLLEELCVDSGVKVKLHTQLVDAVKKSNDHIKYVITESKSGREGLSAQFFIDATGDGDLAARADCGFDLGHPESGNTQPMSLIMLLAGISPSDMEEFDIATEVPSKESKKRLLAEMERAGITPSYTDPCLIHVVEDQFILMTNHQYEVSPVDADEITEATLEARRELHEIVDSLRAFGGKWKSIRIISTADQIGVREGRRIHGIYRITKEDLLQGKNHKDSVCQVTFPIDVHSVDPRESTNYQRPKEQAKPYDIPVRALIARDVNNMLMAGRCISGDFIAHSSYRVGGNAVPMGEAAGTVAALAAQKGISPNNVSWPEAKQPV